MPRSGGIDAKRFAWKRQGRQASLRVDPSSPACAWLCRDDKKGLDRLPACDSLSHSAQILRRRRLRGSTHGALRPIIDADRTVDIEGTVQPQFLPKLPDAGQHLLSQQADTSLGILVANPALAAPQRQNRRTGVLDQVFEFGRALIGSPRSAIYRSRGKLRKASTCHERKRGLEALEEAGKAHRQAVVFPESAQRSRRSRQSFASSSYDRTSRFRGRRWLRQLPSRKAADEQKPPLRGIWCCFRPSCARIKPAADELVAVLLQGGAPPQIKTSGQRSAPFGQTTVPPSTRT